jgi:hypothetical protein
MVMVEQFAGMNGVILHLAAVLVLLAQFVL